MKSKSFFMMMLAGISICFSCCSDNDINTARVQLILVDAPGDYKEVNIDLIDILVNEEGDEEGWKSLDNVNTEIYDLIELTGGTEALLADVELPAGYLNQIRLVLGTANTLKLIDENVVELKTPSAQQSGLKLNIHTELIAGVTYEFYLDWNADKSVIKSGNSGNYILKPVIKVTTVATSGAIKGTVDPAGVYAVTATNNDTDDVIDGVTDENGMFYLHGVPEGTYTVKIIPSGESIYAEKSIDNVVVTIGSVTDTGTIVLVEK